MMSREAIKLAKAWFERNTYGDEAVDVYEALCEALAEQPYEIGTRLAREGKGISDLWGAVKSDADMAEAQRGYEAALADQPAQQEPVTWMEMVVANLVREGVNKHKARELAQHFYTFPPAQRKPLPEKSLHLLAAKHGFQLFAGEDFKNLMSFGRDIEAAHCIKENT